MKKKLLLILFTLLLLIPVKTFALSTDYVDKVSSITNTKVEDNKINLYLFYGKECPHCEQERSWLKDIKEDYKEYLNVYEFEVWHNENNVELMNKVGDVFNYTPKGVPFTVIGDSYFSGYSDTIASKMENKIKHYAKIKHSSNEIKLPILGYTNVKKVSLPIVAVILGFIDGFNPCAMWILLFLINMLFRMKDKKKQLTLGIVFLLVSGIVYFISMLGINLVLGVATISYLKIAIAIFILIAGIMNFKKYLDIKNKEAGCSVVDDKKRKKLITKMKNIMNSKSFFLALIGIITLAVSVNLIELACSLGFPVIFTELLNINHIKGITKIVYLLIYIIFYMLDDMIVFIISMVTLEATGVTNKYNKLCTLISSIIMIIMGTLLLLKPEWLMLNF